MNDDLLQMNPPVWRVACPPPIGRQIMIQELPLRKVGPVLQALAPLIENINVKTGWNLSRVLAAHSDAVQNALAAALDIDAEDIGEMPTTIALKLFQAIVEANKSFFYFCFSQKTVRIRWLS